ncbi:hypothetical protein M885DRAFT_459456 [Pelagophyceae sp. CCMP2097]|nr:hypothetical protein M885DRAFT_459456 [Pelagophyceae sp. CCMP2097]
MAEFEGLEAVEARTQTYLPIIARALAAQKAAPPADDASLVEGKVYRGKVRDVYSPAARDDVIVLVATGRQSAFDRHLATVPFKGDVLNQVSAWWFEQTKDITANHALGWPLPDVCLARRAVPFPIEFVVRAYITGSTDTSLWTHYKAGERNYCGLDFPDGLVKNQKLDKPVCTPTTKDATHDAPIAPDDIVASGRMTREEWDYCAAKALAIFERGAALSAQRGLVLVDTKYEFGRVCLADGSLGDIVLIDEVHTPDSSRFWLAGTYAERFSAGQEPENIDKEFLRLWYRERCDPYADAELPAAPDDLVCELARRYVLLFELITGQRFDFAAEARADPKAKLVAAIQQA